MIDRDPTDTGSTQHLASAATGVVDTPKIPPGKAPRKASRKPPAAATAAEAAPKVETAAARPPVDAPARKALKAARKPAAPAAPKSPKLPAPAAAPAISKTEPVAAKPPKPKARLVRDSFTIPQADFDLIGQLKARALAFQRPAKKSELLRAGLHALVALDDAVLRQALDALVPLKAGRPKKND